MTTKNIRTTHMLKKIVSAVAIALACTACQQQDAHQGPSHVAQAAHHNMVMHTYREHANDSNDWIYLYVLYSDSSSSTSSTVASTPQYYYRSSTPVTNFTSTQFTRVSGGALPKDVKEEEEKSEEVSEQEVTEAQEPADVAQAETQESAAEATSTESAATAGGGRSEPESSEGESSSSDSGSSDGGGGGGGDD
jgi:uncharacterized membrane protein YgcG